MASENIAINPEITIGEYIDHILNSPKSSFESDSKAGFAKAGMSNLKKLIEAGPSADPLVMQAYDSIEGGLSLDTPFHRLNSADQQVMDYMLEQLKFNKKVPLLSDSKVYTPSKLDTIFKEGGAPTNEDLNQRYIPPTKSLQKQLAGGNYSPVNLKSTYDNLRVAIDVFIKRSKNSLKDTDAVPRYLATNNFSETQQAKNLNRFKSWGIQVGTKVAKAKGIVRNVRMVDYIRTIQNAIQSIGEDSNDIKNAQDLTDSQKEKQLRLLRETKNAIKLKLATAIRNTDLFNISSLSKEGIYLDTETMKLFGASQKTGGGQTLPLSNLGRMAVTEQIAEQRNREILRIASREKVSLPEAYDIFVNNVETGYYDRNPLKLFTSTEKEINDLATAFLTNAAEKYETGRVSPITGKPIQGLGLEEYNKKTQKYIPNNELTLSDLRKSLASVIGGDETLGTEDQRKALARQLLGHVVGDATDVASISYIRTFIDDPRSKEFLKSQLLLEQRWAETSGKGTVYKLLEDSSTKGVPDFEPTFADNFPKFNFAVLDQEGNVLEEASPQALQTKIADPVALPAPAKKTQQSLQMDNIFEPPEVNEAIERFGKKITELSMIEGSPFKDIPLEEKNGHVVALVEHFAKNKKPEEISKSVDQGIELLDAVHDQGESIIVFDGRKIPVRGERYSHSDVVHHTLRLGDSKEHSLQNLFSKKGLIKRTDIPQQVKQRTPTQQRKIDQAVDRQLDKFRRRALEIVENQGYDDTVIRYSDRLYEIASKLDADFDEDFSSYLSDNSVSQDTVKQFHSNYTAKYITDANRGKIITGLKKASKTLGTLVPPLKIAGFGTAIAAGLFEPVQRLFKDDISTAKAADLSISELTYDVPEAEKERAEAFRDIQSELSLIGRREVPFTPLDVSETVKGLTTSPEERRFKDRIIQSDKTGTLSQLQDQLSVLDLEQKDPRVTMRRVIDKKFEPKENAYDKVKKQYDELYKRQEIEVKTIDEMNKYELRPFITKETRQDMNENTREINTNNSFLTT